MKNRNLGGIYIERKLFQSLAFCSLTKNGMKFLMALLDQRRLNPAYRKSVKNGHRAERYIDLDKIKLPYKTVHKKYKIPEQSIPAAIDDGLAKGFFIIVHSGGRGEHDKNIYALVEDYLDWTPGDVIRKRVKDVKRGFQGKRLGAVKNSHVKTEAQTHLKT